MLHRAVTLYAVISCGFVVGMTNQTVVTLGNQFQEVVQPNITVNSQKNHRPHDEPIIARHNSPHKTTEKRVYLSNCATASPEQMSYTINEHMLNIKKNTPFYHMTTRMAGFYELASRDAQYAYTKLSLLAKHDKSILSCPGFIENLRKENYYFNGLINLVVDDFKNKAQNVNGETLVQLFNYMDILPLSIRAYIEETLQNYFAIDFTEANSFYATDLYGEGNEIVPGSVYISEDDRYIKCTDEKGRTLIWETSTAERVAPFSSGIRRSGAYWLPMIRGNSDTSFISVSGDYMIKLFKDGKIIGAFEKLTRQCDSQEECPVMQMMFLISWKEQLVVDAIWGSTSVEQLQILLKSKFFNKIRPVLRVGFEVIVFLKMATVNE